MIEFYKCKRCGDHSYELLRGYGHCVSCFYSHDIDGFHVQQPSIGFGGFNDRKRL